MVETIHDIYLDPACLRTRTLSRLMRRFLEHFCPLRRWTSLNPTATVCSCRKVHQTRLAHCIPFLTLGESARLRWMVWEIGIAVPPQIHGQS